MRKCLTVAEHRRIISVYMKNVSAHAETEDIQERSFRKGGTEELWITEKNL